jgi:hypothetical protein
MSKKESIEAAVARLETELSAIEPRDASLWAVVQMCRASIMAKRLEGASWAQIAAAVRAAGFPNATETNVRLAAQAREPLKKVSKARRRQQKQTPPNPIQSTSAAAPTADGPALLRNRWK